MGQKDLFGDSVTATTPACEEEAAVELPEFHSILECYHQSGTEENTGETNGCVGSESRERKGKPATKKTAVTRAELLNIIESQEYCCAICGIELTPSISELDHKIPRSDGGTDACGNLQWVCKPCNRAKGELSMAAFVAMCKRIVMRHGF